VARVCIVLGLLFLAVLPVTRPAGDFPLNDDWSYGTAVRTLVEQGRYQLHDWTSMPLFGQVIWGTLFCLPAGFSFTALRVSTLALSLAALLLLALLAHRAGIRERRLLLLAPLLLFCCPVFLGLSHTFMTDVPFLSFSLASLVLLLAGQDRRSPYLIFLGVFAAVLATLLRQSGLLLPVAFGIAWLSQPGPRARRILPSIGFVALCLGALLAHDALLRAGPGLPSGYGAQYAIALASGGLLLRVLGNVVAFLVYTGIFLLPLGILLVPTASKRRLLLFLAVAAGAMALIQLGKVSLPGNILTDRGLGPFQLPAASSFTAFSPSLVSRASFGLLALLGSALLLETIYRAVGAARRGFTPTLLLVLAGLYFASILPVPQFDRYMLVYIPVLGVPALATLDVSRTGRPWFVAAFCLLALYGLFAVVATHDYLAWNRARWQGLNHLTRDLAVPAERIDGGFEFNGLYTFSDDYERTPDRNRWWVRDDEYVVSLDSLPGYEVLAGCPTGTWLPGAVKRIYTLHRTGPVRAESPARP
jgi:hypothetical protein